MSEALQNCVDKTSLNEQILQFCRRLKAEGLTLSQSDSVAALKGLSCIDLLDKNHFYYALRTTLCFSEQDYLRFDRVYRGFWGEEAPMAGQEKRFDGGDENKESKSMPDADLTETEHDEATSDNQQGEPADRAELELDDKERQELDMLRKLATYSPTEQLVLKEFLMEQFATDSIMQKQFTLLLKQLRKLLVNDLGSIKSNRIHLPKTIRKSMQVGASEIFRLYPRTRRPNKYTSLVTLADISGSMEHDMKIYLPLIYRLHRVLGNSEAYFFNTQVHHVTPYFRHGFGQVCQQLNERLDRVSNGTNLGQSLQQFRAKAGSSLSPNVTSVFIVSDGWDRGDMQLLEEQMSALRKQVLQIIWLNPLLGRQGYTPLTSAIEVTKPYIDFMVSAQDMSTLSKQN